MKLFFFFKKDQFAFTGLGQKGKKKPLSFLEPEIKKIHFFIFFPFKLQEYYLNILFRYG